MARAFYEIINGSFSIALFDEFDKNLDEKLAIQLMNSIINFCHKRKIMCFIAVHTSAVKKMPFDKVITACHNVIMS